MFKTFEWYSDSYLLKNRKLSYQVNVITSSIQTHNIALNSRETKAQGIKQADRLSTFDHNDEVATNELKITISRGDK